MLGTVPGNANKAVNKRPCPENLQSRGVGWVVGKQNQYKMLDVINTMEKKIKQGKGDSVGMRDCFIQGGYKGFLLR